MSYMIHPPIELSRPVNRLAERPAFIASPARHLSAGLDARRQMSDFI